MRRAPGAGDSGEPEARWVARLAGHAALALELLEVREDGEARHRVERRRNVAIHAGDDVDHGLGAGGEGGEDLGVALEPVGDVALDDRAGGLEDRPMGGVDAPDVELEDMLVDNAAMQLATAPEQFDVILTENLFGDILSDLAAALTGGLGLAPSASLGDSGPGIFEPVHGSAPDIAGRGIANPAGMLRSTALLLEHGLGRGPEARALDDAVETALVQAPTPDRGGTSTTDEFADAVVAALASTRVRKFRRGRLKGPGRCRRTDDHGQESV